MKFNNRNITIGENVTIGKNVKIGDDTIIYDNVIIGDNTIICNNCILGEPLNNYYYSEEYENPPLVIGSNSLIRSHCIFYAGSEFGDNLQIFDEGGNTAMQFLWLGGAWVDADNYLDGDDPNDYAFNPGDGVIVDIQNDGDVTIAVTGLPIAALN